MDPDRHRLLEPAKIGRAPMRRITLANALREERDHARRNSDVATNGAMAVTPRRAPHIRGRVGYFLPGPI